MKMIQNAPNVDHMAFRSDLVELLGKHTATLNSLEMLAISAHVVGQLMALMDASRVTPEMALNLVIKNIEQGNNEAVADATRNMH